MATVLITSAVLVSPEHAHHLSEVDVLLEDGIIKFIGKQNSIDRADIEVIDAKGSYIAPGFFDLNANFGEPGLETKEDLQTGIASAAAGGFTGVAIHPNTNPAIYTRSEVALIVNQSRGAVVDVHPVGAISKKRQGEELAELYDMKLAGAIAFSDGDHSVQQAGLMSRALLYSKGFDGLIMAFAQDESIAGGNKMNEGEVSTYLGMKGIPNLAEELMVSRNIKLAAYHDARIHFSTISTAGSVDLIRQAKENGLQVTCDVAAHHLLLTDESVTSFDSNYKVSPPLRTQQDVDALREGLRDGTIDAVVSQHTPHEIEFKQVEFHIAADGIASLQTVLPTLLSAGLSAEEIVDVLAIRPRQVVGLPLPTMEEGAVANFVLFDPTAKWTYDQKSNQSKGANNPWFGKELVGKVLLTANNKQLTRYTK
ncbi:dihydroorotase [Sphingobacterium corticibacter]|uniref:Dihydroorotase n=1 Tax=Sphingobacterium corticibacter TaxID=2171749 RepID=A0A2T8HGA0_9SPHI|nr:dihydroorotase [Sphingobacterium corticibacter]PVH24471.1 dihydroorotase [Sphingobacterium corticibacter]